MPAVDLRTLARVQALGRVAVGAAFTLAPTLAGATWVGRGAAAPEARVLAIAFGVRDLAIGMGAAWALGGGGAGGARPWLVAGTVADAVDFYATVSHRDRLPRAAVLGAGALGASSAALGLYLQARLD
jgi:hypothetical protein